MLLFFVSVIQGTKSKYSLKLAGYKVSHLFTTMLGTLLCHILYNKPHL